MPAGRKLGGRQKGTPNKITADLREMVMGALADAGGRKYLTEQATENPVAFLGLVGKCLPKDINLKADVTLEQLITEASRPAIPPDARPSTAVARPN